VNSVQNLAQDTEKPFGWNSAEASVESPRKFFSVRCNQTLHDINHFFLVYFNLFFTEITWYE